MAISPRRGKRAAESPDSPLLGRTEPRIFTPPLRPLTPDTTDGFRASTWLREKLHLDLFPWQHFLLVHALEKLPDGSPRFRYVGVLKGRQNGATTLVNALALWWMAECSVPLVAGTSVDLGSATESWEGAVSLAEEYADDLGGPPRVHRVNGRFVLKLPNGCRYRVLSATRRGGRSYTIHRAIEDELLEHDTFDAHAAIDGATTAVPDSQVWMLSNAGSSRSVVLLHFRALGLSGEMPQLGWFEWSAPDGCALDDRQAWAQANPSLGRTITEFTLESKLLLPASTFRSENLAQFVDALDEAVPREAWNLCADPGTMAAVRSQVAVCLDISEDLRHSTLVAAAQLPDGRTRVETVQAWMSTLALLADLPTLLARVRPRVVGYLSRGPSASLDTQLAKLNRSRKLTPTEVSAAVMGLAESVQSGRIAHSSDELITSHLLSAGRKKVGDQWTLQRADGQHLDAAFATAGAVWLSKQLPRPTPLKVLTARAPVDS